MSQPQLSLKGDSYDRVVGAPRESDPTSQCGLPLHLLGFSFPHPDPHTGLNIIACFLSLSQHTLRRMCYLTIKEMSSIAEDVIIVTSRQVWGLWMAVLMGSIDAEAIFSHVY